LEKYEENYKRVEATLNLEEPDRVPRWDVIDNEQLWKLGGKFSVTWEHNELKVFVEGDPLEVCARAHRATGIDVSRYRWWFADFDWLKAKFYEFVKFLGLNREEWGIKSKAFGVSWISKRPFTDVDGMEDFILQNPDEDSMAEWLIPLYERTKESYAREGVVLVGNEEGPLTNAYTLARTDLFAKAIYMAPKMVERWLDVFEKYAYIHAKIWAEHEFGPAFFIGEDIAFGGSARLDQPSGSGLMFSGEWLKKHLFPRIKRIMTPLRKKNIKFIFHSDGNLYPILDYLVNEVRIDALNPIEPAAGMNIGEVKEKYGDKIVLIGNVDCTHLLPRGTPKEVAEVTKKTIEVAAPGGGFLIGSSSELHNSIPVENALTLHRTAKKYGRYPIHFK
jgi:uroporphyrinogen decarboxylase